MARMVKTEPPKKKEKKKIKEIKSTIVCHLLVLFKLPEPVEWLLKNTTVHFEGRTYIFDKLTRKYILK